MKDPYEVLGVSRDASDEDIKKAYRRLAKQYHPDVNPGNRQAEEKMKEINAAYDAIKDASARQSYAAGGSTGSAGTGGYGGYGGAYGPHGSPFGDGYGGQQGQWRTYTWDPFTGFHSYGEQSEPQESPEMRAARNYIAARHYQEALHVLSGINPRDARWYYYSAIANAGLGSRVTALEHAREACRLDPGNAEYETYLSELQRGGQTYRQAGGYAQSGDAGSWCLRLCMANLLCNLCCRGCWC